MTTCYQCGCSVGGGGVRRDVYTGGNSWASVGRRGQWRVGAGSRTSRRTFCARCADRIDANELGLVLTIVLAVGGIASWAMVTSGNDASRLFGILLGMLMVTVALWLPVSTAVAWIRTDLRQRREFQQRDR